MTLAEYLHECYLSKVWQAYKTKIYDLLRSYIENYSDYLIVYGKLKNEANYRFIDRANKLKYLLKNKNVFCLDIPGVNYAPHPGNRKIFYNNINFEITEYYFHDI